MKFFVTKIFTFDSAHYLENYNGKCERLHGHTYKLEVCLTGQKDEAGLVFDFSELKKIVNEQIITRLDHNLLNKTLDFNPSAENILEWVWNQLKSKLNDKKYCLYSLKLWETPTSFAEIKEDA